MTEQALRECPFCGKNPTIYPADPKTEGNAWAQVRCDYIDCVANPRVSDGEEDAADCIDYRQLAINRWNTRAYYAEREELMRVKREYESLKKRATKRIETLKVIDALKINDHRRAIEELQELLK
jgi:hypothetical protein